MPKFKFWPFRTKTNEETCCEELREMSAYLVDPDGEPPPGLMERLGRHLERCQMCTAFIRTLQSTVGLVQHLPSQSASEDFRDRLRNLVNPSKQS